MNHLPLFTGYKKYFVMGAILLISPISPQKSMADEDQSIPNLSAPAYIELFKKCMVDMVENMQADEKIIASYVSPKYTQWVDGKKIDYKGFVRHMAVQKQHVKSVKVYFLQVIAMDNVVSTIHEVSVTKKDGSKGLIKVIGHMTYEGDKLVKVDELTFVLKGNLEDKKLGSIN